MNGSGFLWLAFAQSLFYSALIISPIMLYLLSTVNKKGPDFLKAANWSKATTGFVATNIALLMIVSIAVSRSNWEAFAPALGPVAVVLTFVFASLMVEMFKKKQSPELA